eukprot:g41671.t1
MGKTVQTPEKHAEPTPAADDGGLCHRGSLGDLKASKIIFWSRVCTVEQDELFLFQKVHVESSVLSSLKEEDGSVTSSQSDILRISKFFYASLYDMKATDSASSHRVLYQG